jgi:ketosteroid isomerase-like protein
MEVFRGRAGAQQAWQTFKEAMGLTVRFDDFRDAGDRVLGLGQLTGTGRTTGLEVGGEIAQLATFRDGKVVRMEDFSTHAEGLRAAGLSE